jgi:hypothetical protein
MTDQWLARIRRVVAGLFMATTLCICFSCESEPRMFPLSPRFNDADLTKVPLILVGQAVENCHPVGPLQFSRWDNRPVQLWKVKVKVEHVVQGDITQKVEDIFYFVDQGASTGGISHLTDIYAGHSEIFFLQRDGRKWRTICDGWRSCVLWVRTGPHYKYKIDFDLPIKDILVNLVLSRGNQTSDRQMIDAIYHRDGRWGWKPVINRLKELAKEDRSPQVRAVALDEFRELQKVYGNRSEIARE